MKTKKKLLSLLMTIAMIVGVLPVMSVLAEGASLAITKAADKTRSSGVGDTSLILTQ